MAKRNRSSGKKHSVVNEIGRTSGKDGSKTAKKTKRLRVLKDESQTAPADSERPTQLLWPYPGSKWGLAKEYSKYYPPHLTWVSVFGGTGAEIALKPPCKLEVWNDIDRSLHNVFAVLQDDKLYERLIRLWESTPDGREQYEECSQIVRNPGEDPVSNAWAFLVTSTTGFRGVHPAVSTSWCKNNTVRLRKLPEILAQWKQRFRRVKLESCRWQEILKRYDDPQTFFFTDPPYYPETLSHKLYRHELDTAEHEELLSALQNVQGKVLLCGYEHPLYREQLSHWRRIDFKTCAQVARNRPPRTETIWLNFDETGLLLRKPPTIFAIPRCKSSKPELSDIDQELLDGIERRRRTLATMIRGVIDKDTTAFFVYGPGGHGKSKLIRDALKGHKKVKTWNSDMSARALVEKLQEFPDYIHFFEDLEKIYKDSDCQGLLIAACGGKRNRKRMVQWHKHRVDIDFEFTGGIIIASNNRLDPKPGRLGAVASRFTPQLWKLSDPELAALMRQIALTEYREYRLTQAEAWEVAQFVIAQMEQRSGQGKVDLRTLCEQAIPDFKQWKDGRSEVHWHELVRARINGAPTCENRRARNERLQYVACEVHFTAKTLSSRLNLWKSRTLGEGQDGEGLGKQAFYDRLKEAKEGGLFAQLQQAHREDAA